MDQFYIQTMTLYPSKFLRLLRGTKKKSPVPSVVRLNQSLPIELPKTCLWQAGRPFYRPVQEDWEVRLCDSHCSSAQIDSKQIKISHKVGQGAFGTVYQGEYFGRVAVKTFDIINPTDQQLEAFRNEVSNECVELCTH